MGKSNFAWGAPSMSEDIFNNMSKTHHKEKIYDNSIAHDLGKAFITKGNYERPFHEVLVRNHDIDYVAENTYIEGVFDTKNDYEDFEADSYFDDYDEFENSF